MAISELGAISLRPSAIGATPEFGVVNVLALQGDFAAHARALARHRLLVREVRSAEHLGDHPAAGLVLPGGESTSMLRLMEGTHLGQGIVSLTRAGVPILATCAGVILLAREVRDPAQASLGVLDVVVQRNGYGRQIDSAIVPLRAVAPFGSEEEFIEGVFIRAPRIVALGAGVEVLARRGDDPVLVRQGNILAATFHPELSPESPVLALFANMVAERCRASA